MTPQIEELALSYRMMEPVVTVIAQVEKFKIDSTIFSELKSYRVYKQENEIKRVTGPEDYDILSGILDTVHRSKDRVCEIQLNLKSLQYDVNRLYRIVFDFLCLKPVMINNLKNEAQRQTFVNLTIPEVVERRDALANLIDIADQVTKNLNQTINIAREQSVVVQQKMYWRKLTLPDEKNHDRS